MDASPKSPRPPAGQAEGEQPPRGRQAPWPAWLRPRPLAWLVTLALVGALHFLAAPLLLRVVVTPAADADGQGWLLLRGPGPGGQAFAAPDAWLSADQGVALTAYALWMVPRGGTYSLYLKATSPSRLALDGQDLTHLDSQLRGQVDLELSAGPHLLRLEGTGGSRALWASGPEGGPANPLDGGHLRPPSPQGIAAWWGLLSVTEDPRLAVLAALAATFLLILLPYGAHRGWPGLAAVVVMIGAPALLLPGPSQQVPFVGGPDLLRLKAENPDYVVIGNSLADGSIDKGAFKELTGGKVSKLIYSGSEATIHYLMFKNILVASGARPKVTFIFTRENDLTNPHLQVMPKAFASLSPTREDDPLVEDLVYGAFPLWERLGRRLERVFEITAYRASINDSLPGLFQTVAGGLGADQNSEDLRKIRKRANSRFSLERLRQRQAFAPPTGPDRWKSHYEDALYLDFDKVVESSFLPHFLSLAAEHHLRLVFVRVQRRPTAAGPPPQEPQMIRYVQRLRAYLEARGAGFHDFTGDPELTVDYYMADDHILDAARFTRLFCRRLAWALP